MKMTPMQAAKQQAAKLGRSVFLGHQEQTKDYVITDNPRRLTDAGGGAVLYTFHPDGSWERGVVTPVIAARAD